MLATGLPSRHSAFTRRVGQPPRTRQACAVELGREGATVLYARGCTSLRPKAPGRRPYPWNLALDAIDQMVTRQ